MNSLWQPSSNFTRGSNLFHFARFLEKEFDLKFDDYASMWDWSVTDVDAFWKAIWKYYDIQHDGSFSHSHSSSVCGRTGSDMLSTKWFEGTKVNYTEHVFKAKTKYSPAIIFQSEHLPLQEISWAELEQQVASFTQYLRKNGIQKDDRVAAYLPNIPQALVAFLATNAVGAVWSSCSPDFGTPSVLDRLTQIEPKILIACDGYSYNGKKFSKIDAVNELIANLPSVQKVVMVNYIGEVKLEGADSYSDILKLPAEALRFERVDFNDPIWVLYSSGTTGKPKAITHSVGGMLIEHLKALGLHQNCKRGDKFFWYSTTGWMMWNYANAALLHGTTVVIYDGAPAYPNINVLWDLARDTQITYFGAGASFYISCMKEGVDRKQKLEHIQSLGSTGSPLPPEAFEWIYKSIKKDLWLVSLSGGTDICSGFVGGNPYDAVYAGEIQCRLLGCKVEAYNEKGIAVYDELGEMVIEKPMPSMPIYFWGDINNEKYRASYFEMYPGKWRHGDWIKITDRKTVIIFGRSDATLNRGGVRIGTSEVYSAVESVSEIKDSMVICTDEEGGEHYMPLFVVLKDGFVLNDELKAKIKGELRKQYSPRHVPDEIIEVKEIPYTISGKKMETPVKKLLMGIPLEKVASADAMKNPGSLEFFVNFAKKRKS
jgi:acetoacetyl-CoA synthetase